MPDPPSFDTWEVEEQLRHIARLLGISERDNLGPVDARLDSAHTETSGWHRPNRHRPAVRPNRRSDSGKNLVGLFGSISAWFGAASLTCGAVLLGWGQLAHRTELQTIGLPIAIGGVLMIALGVMLQFNHGLAQPCAPTPSGKHRFDATPANAVPRPNARRPAHRPSDKAA